MPLVVQDPFTGGARSIQTLLSVTDRVAVQDVAGNSVTYETEEDHQRPDRIRSLVLGRRFLFTDVDST